MKHVHEGLNGCDISHYSGDSEDMGDDCETDQSKDVLGNVIDAGNHNEAGYAINYVVAE